MYFPWITILIRLFRNNFLTLLNQLKIDDSSRLKESGIGARVNKMRCVCNDSSPHQARQSCISIAIQGRQRRTNWLQGTSFTPGPGESSISTKYIKKVDYRPIFHKEDNPAHMTREDRREKDAAVAARHRAEGGTRWARGSLALLTAKVSSSTSYHLGLCACLCVYKVEINL